VNTVETIWKPAPEQLQLGHDDVHVWRAPLDQPETSISAFSEILSTDELRRAGRFHFRKDGERFIVARAVLKCILSRYLNIKPELIRFRSNQYGKPALVEAAADASGLRFNLSHSRALALYGIARERELGLDLEDIRSDLGDDAQIARQFFSKREVAALAALPANLRSEGFFRCWTRKEAYIKAKGMGLSIPLDQFDVTLSPDEPALLLDVAGDAEEVSRWSLRELAPGPGYMAALVVEGQGWQLDCFQWPDGSPQAVCRERE
jgi:4'-phosphopantetheinyl transferase